MNFEDVEAGNVMKINDIDWILEEQVGEGGNGVVWSALKGNSKSEKIAIKFVMIQILRNLFISTVVSVEAKAFLDSVNTKVAINNMTTNALKYSGMSILRLI